MSPRNYNAQEIDAKWQKRWEDDQLYRPENDDSKPKWYALTMFPYTSGDLHIGHWYAETPADAHARFMHMKGYNVLHPMGFDSFGLPAENAAIQRDIHPRTWTMNNVETMRRQLRTLGATYAWDREVVTCLPEYYQWNQYFFLKMLEAGLAYRDRAPVNWCEKDQTTLAREQVTPAGTCERCDTPVIQKDLEQWFFRVTKYADELLDYSQIDWPEKITLMQTNWIGRSEGAEIAFGLDVPGVDAKELRVFTTRPDTSYGVTFMVLAPEHPLVAQLTTPENKATVEEYVAQTRRATEIERLSTEREKTGVALGSYCINNLNGEKVALYIADYVLMGYGTGIVMGVPSHDQRDFEFATERNIPIRVVISPPDWDGQPLTEAYIAPGTMVDSGPFDGITNEEGKTRVVEHLNENGWGGPTVSYRIRDWLISRQRYWGTPIPVVYCPKDGMVPLPESQLPVLLPEDAEFKPTGESPLKYHDEFLHTTCPKCNGPAERETDTMDTFVDSSWYFLRYTSPDAGNERPFDPQEAERWCPVDMYMGGAEHAVMHLLYARFFTKALRDMGFLKFDEPFVKLFNQGIILGDDHQKMSKSRGNVVNPDAHVSTQGADAVRAFLMFVGPWDQGGSWSDQGIQGISRWMDRVWDIAAERDAATLPANDESGSDDLRRIMHKTIRRVSQDMERMRFNTMIAGLMEYTNEMTRLWDAKSVDAAAWREGVDALLLMLAPTTPHVAEELWERTGHAYSIHNESWPTWDEAMTQDVSATLVVQVDGKVRDRLPVSADISEEGAKELAFASERVLAHTKDKTIANVRYIEGRFLLNVVTR